MTNPTRQCYEEFRRVFHHFNGRMFDGKLPHCLITLQRRNGVLGHFAPKRYVNRCQQNTDEIALNPAYFAERTDKGICSTLVHEMAHQWQSHFGTTGRRGYHNRQWADRMIKLGLFPSHTGKPGGHETGYQMTHYIVEGGQFEAVTNELIASGFHFSWLDNQPKPGNVDVTGKPIKGENNSNRWKYTCPRCGLNVWAKPAALIICGRCNPGRPLMNSKEAG